MNGMEWIAALDLGIWLRGICIDPERYSNARRWNARRGNRALYRSARRTASIALRQPLRILLHRKLLHR